MQFERDKDFDYPRELDYLNNVKYEFRTKVTEKRKYAKFMVGQRKLEEERIIQFKVEDLKAKVRLVIPYALHGRIYTYKGIPRPTFERTLYLPWGLRITIVKDK